jgi:LCP family protein required for cell wall assembly
MNKRLLWMIASAGLGLVAAGFVGALISFNKMVVIKNIPKNTPVLVSSPTPTPTPDPLAPVSILLLGYGGGRHEGGLLTDSIMVVRIEPRNQKINLISIPRDLWAPMPIGVAETKSFKLNAAYAIGSDDKRYPNKAVEFTGKAGGGEMAMTVISQIVGFKIDNFAALDFDGFVKMIDLLGGIDVNVARTFDDPFYPIEEKTMDNCGKSEDELKAMTATASGEKLDQLFSCRYDPLHFDKGRQHFDGKTALKFARSRHSPTDGGDFNRAARQRLVVEAVKAKVISIGFLPKVIPALKLFTYNLTTDVDLAKMRELLTKMTEYSTFTIESVALTDKNVLSNAKSSDGQYILAPRTGENNWEEIHRFIKNPTATLAPLPTVTPAIKALE